MLQGSNCTQKIIYFFIVPCFLFFSFSCSEKNPLPGNAATGRQWGIEITRLHLSANGYMVDFRYRVLDPVKAAELFVRKNRPYLIEQKSGRVLAVPNIGKIGPLRTSNKPKKNKIYWMFFENIAGVVHPGSKVTVVIGNFRTENLVVL